MREGDMLRITVPGSTANLGPGFDSVGLALSLYLHVDVELSENWEVIPLSDELKKFPLDQDNYLIEIALHTAKKFGVDLPPCRIMMKSDIPLARGLGSSAAAIIAGIQLANHVGELNLKNDEIFQLAASIEGHPDNVGASLYGGLVIGSQFDTHIEAVVYKDINFHVIAAVPNEELLTSESRNVLPNSMTYSDSVMASSVANVMIAAFLTGEYEKAGRMMKRDRFHEPYRSSLIPQLKELECIASKHGAFGVALSGAGPTVLCCCEHEYADKLLQGLTNSYPTLTYLSLDVDKNGSQVYMQKTVEKNKR